MGEVDESPRQEAENWKRHYPFDDPNAGINHSTQVSPKPMLSYCLA